MSFTTLNVEKIQRSQIWRMRGPGNGSPLFLANNQETPCPERHKYNEEK
jgi:hypothetical protein